MTKKTFNLKNLHRTPQGWPLRQLRIEQAHKITQGDSACVVAVVDLGYRSHRDVDGHLWRNPNPTTGDIHGWDFADNDATLEHTGPQQDTSRYYRGHHTFVASEIAAIAPKCPIMIVRIGYANCDSWAAGIRYAVDNGARILVIPHGYLTGDKASGQALFFQGADFTYPFDNPDIRTALDYAYDKGCLVVRGAADNRGRRVAFANAGLASVFAVGSTNRHDEPADICCSADYVQVGAPGGQRQGNPQTDHVWGCGGDQNMIPFTGGCMASGFGGAVAALTWSKFPNLTVEQLGQVLRNTARPARNVTPDETGWEPKLGYGILNAAKAVSVKPAQLCRDVRLIPSSVTVRKRKGKTLIDARIKNHGVFDAEKAIVVAYNGNPAKPVEPEATRDSAAQLLQTKQIGHTIASVRGLHETTMTITLIETPTATVWFETFTLDMHDAAKLHRTRIKT